MKDERNFIHFSDGSRMFHAFGKKDAWCVYYEAKKSKPKAMLDKEYFSVLKWMADTYGKDKVYSDFVLIYDATSERFDERVIELIKEKSNSYKGSEIRAEKLFCILYMAMVSEYHYVSNRGEPSKLNKKVKRLAVHQILNEGYSVNDAAKFSYGKNPEKLNELCNQYGF